MVRPIEPDEPGFSPSRWLGHLINVGLALARSAGTGLGLFNAVRDQVEAASREDIGEAVSIVGQGVRAAQSFSQPPHDQPLSLAGLPAVPADYFGGQEASRVLAVADVNFTDDRDNEDQEWNTIVDVEEGMTFEELEDAIRNKFGDCAAWTDPELCDHLVNVYVNLFFLAKRF